MHADTIYRKLFETAGEGLIVTDHTGEIVLANPRALTMFGYEEAGLVGQTIEVLVPDGHRHKHQAHRDGYQHAPRARRMGLGMDLQGKRFDSTTFPVEISLNHLTVDGSPLVMALITDITERKVATDRVAEMNLELEQLVQERTTELDKSQLLYRTIARNFPNGTINVFDADLNYIFVEGREMKRLGVSSEALIGTNFLQQVPADVRDLAEVELRKVFGGTEQSFEVEHLDQSYELHAVPLEDANGTIGQILVVENNVTAFKDAADKANNALNQQIALNDMKSRFISMASHEFRTPLSTILSSVSLLTKYIELGQADRITKHTGRIRNSVAHLTGILNDFLSLEKLEQGSASANLTPSNIAELGADVAEEMQALAKKGQQIRFRFEGDNTPILTDTAMLRNIALNLLSNACKYSPENSTIRFDLIQENATVSIQVEDQGMGIPEADQVNLFGRFFRASNATNIQGTGLGLNIVKKYVELLNGTIDFVSTDGEGSTFTIFIPIPKQL